MYLCKTCGKNFFEDFRKSKKIKRLSPEPEYCSKSCSNSRERTPDTIDKVRKSLRKFHENNNVKHSEETKRKIGKKINVNRKLPKSILDFSSRTTGKIIKRMNIPCSFCGWYVKNVAGDIHHIIKESEGGKESNENLSYLCPNCHRLAHSGVIDASELVSIAEQLGEKWRDYYYD